jgi:hypothetical protein
MWSYRKLVAEYGEDLAILLLEFMDGLGEFNHHVDQWEYNTDTPYDDVHDYVPISFDATPLSQLTLDHGFSGVDIRLWRQKKERETTSST